MLITHLREERRSVLPEGETSRSTWVRMCEAAIQELWDEATHRLAGGPVKGVALAAVGSLGRRDCGPESDIDLVLLHDGVDHPEIAGGVPGLADALWYPLWDSHVDLDHSVRSLSQCRDVASSDLAASIALLDIRCIAGDAGLVSQASRLIHSDWRRGARLRFAQLEEERNERIARAGELAYEIEGDIKQAAGGIRDVLMIRALVASWLAERPAVDYSQAHAFLLDVRDALASITRRHGHVLAIRLHTEVAHLLGIEGEYPEDELLVRVSNAARIIRGAYEDTAARARRNVTPTRMRRRLVRGKRRPVFDVVAPGIIHATGELALASDAYPDRDSILDLSLYSIRNNLPIRQATLINLKEERAWNKRAHKEVLQDKCNELWERGVQSSAPEIRTQYHHGETYGARPHCEPWTVSDREKFEEILASGPAQVLVWEQLDLAELISDIIDQWLHVRNVPQRSIIHRHTVDRHQIEAVSLLPSSRTLENKGMMDLPARHRSALLLATFLHDIGKRPGKPGHSKRGAGIAKEIVRGMGYSQEIVDDVETLVRHHLLLGDLATSADPTDAATQHRIRSAVGHGTLLDCLHLLTQADARSCKPEAWDDWKASLVAELVLTARQEHA